MNQRVGEVVQPQEVGQVVPADEAVHRASVVVRVRQFLGRAAEFRAQGAVDGEHRVADRGEEARDSRPTLRVDARRREGEQEKEDDER